MSFGFMRVWMACVLATIGLVSLGTSAMAACGTGGGGQLTGGCGPGGSRGVVIPAKPLPPLDWESLNNGLSKAEKAGKPLVVVFTTKDYKGPATFESEALRDGLKKSGLVIVKVVPPEAPKVADGVQTEESKSARAAYEEALKKYQEVAAKYEVTNINPTMIFLAPDGSKVASLPAPQAGDVTKTFQSLPAMLEQIKANKQQVRQEKPANPVINAKG